MHLSLSVLCFQGKLKTDDRAHLALACRQAWGEMVSNPPLSYLDPPYSSSHSHRSPLFFALRFLTLTACSLRVRKYHSLGSPNSWEMSFPRPSSVYPHAGGDIHPAWPH